MKAYFIFEILLFVFIGGGLTFAICILAYEMLKNYSGTYTKKTVKQEIKTEYVINSSREDQFINNLEFQS